MTTPTWLGLSALPYAPHMYQPRPTRHMPWIQDETSRELYDYTPHHELRSASRTFTRSNIDPTQACAEHDFLDFVVTTWHRHHRRKGRLHTMHYITPANSSLTPSPRSTSTWFSSQNNLVNTSPQLHHPLGWADIVCSTIDWRHDIDNIINRVGCRGTTSTHRHHCSDDLYNHTRMVLKKRLCACWFPPLTRVNSTNVLDEGLRIGGIGRRMNSKVKSVKQGVYRK
jgi:hypothetical protein